MNSSQKEIVDFFNNCTISGNFLHMPEIIDHELEKSFYLKNIKQPLLDLGGIYISANNSWKFEFDPTQRIDEIKNNSKTKLSSKYHFFETPIELCGNMFQFAEECGIQWWRLLDVKNCKCLEPSAGRGKLIQRLFIQGFKNVYYFENMPENIQILSDFDYYGNIPKYLGDDFLKCKDFDFDLVVANPPFRHEVKHIENMMRVLKPGGILISLSSPKLYNDKNFEDFLKKQADVWGMRELESDKDYPVFSGTNIGCTIICAIKKQTTLF